MVVCQYARLGRTIRAPVWSAHPLARRRTPRVESSTVPRPRAVGEQRPGKAGDSWLGRHSGEATVGFRLLSLARKMETNLAVEEEDGT